MTRSNQITTIQALSLLALITVLITPALGSLKVVDEQRLAYLKEKYGKIYESAQQRAWSHAQPTDRKLIFT